MHWSPRPPTTVRGCSPSTSKTREHSRWLGTWPAVGMPGSDSRSVAFHAVGAEPVGGPRRYLDRPGFWHGAVGVAACWYGGAVGIGAPLLRAARDRDLEPHALACLGAVDAALSAMADTLDAEARRIDADPTDGLGLAQLRARRVRAAVEAGTSEVIARVGQALGAAPLCLDHRHARRVTDLTVYVRQSHAGRDLECVGRLAVKQSAWGTIR